MDTWKDVIGSNGAYKINISGHVKNLDRYKNIGYGGSQPLRSKVLKMHIHCNGYPAHRLKLNGKSRIAFIHRMLAQVFIPNPDNKPFVNHKNGIKTDNRVENLEWVTSAENNRHAFDTGLRKPYSKVSKDDRKNIRDLYNIYQFTQRAIAEIYGITNGTVSQIINFKKVYAHG